MNLPTQRTNHSGEFYTVLLSIMPDNKERLRWLRDNGQKLSAEGSGARAHTLFCQNKEPALNDGI